MAVKVTVCSCKFDTFHHKVIWKVLASHICLYPFIVLITFIYVFSGHVTLFSLSKSAFFTTVVESGSVTIRDVEAVIFQPWPGVTKDMQTEHELIRTNKLIGIVSFLITLGPAA